MTEKDRKARRSENAIQRYIRETTGELRKVSWPTWPEARRLTWLVLLVMLIMGVFLAGVDLGSRELLNLILGVQ